MIVIKQYILKMWLHMKNQPFAIREKKLSKIP